MQEIITNGLMTFGAGFATAAISKAQGPGQALDDIMTLVGFEKLHEVAEIKRAKRELNVQQFKESIAQKITAIPEENLQEPPLSIVGAALEASKFYIEEGELREMFANLIAASMDFRQNFFTHPSYVELIKQLSPRDAQVLKYIKERIRMTVTDVFPIMKMVKVVGEGRMNTIFPLIAIFSQDDDFRLNATTVNNLERLGIIETSFTSWLSNDESYDFIRNNSLVVSVLKESPEANLENGLMRLTNYGQNFLNVCV